MESRFVICDIEATGLHEEKEIIEIALITLEDDRVVDVYETLVNPLLPVSDYILNLTSISPRDLENAPKFYDIAEALRLRLEGAVFVSHKTDFDLELLQKNFARMGQELKLKSFCTLKVAQQEIPGLTNYNLDALCSFFSIKVKDRHRALGDARATLELFRELWNLRNAVSTVERYLPQHGPWLKEIVARAGLLKFKNAEGKVIRWETAFNMRARAHELLEVRRENRELLESVASVTGEVTGSALIAEFRKRMMRPVPFHWMIGVEERQGEKFFKISPFRKGAPGLWPFTEYLDAKAKLRSLVVKLKGERFAYRDGGKSKEEILKHNQQVEQLCREARFPAENLVLVGEGRTSQERSVVLIREGHVLGFGYTEASEEDIYQHPEAYLTHRFARHAGMDQLARNYLRVLKNLKTKNEGWRSLSDHAKLPLYEPKEF